MEANCWQTSKVLKSGGTWQNGHIRGGFQSGGFDIRVLSL